MLNLEATEQNTSIRGLCYALINIRSLDSYHRASDRQGQSRP
jgi:hypothetical protein